MLYHFQSRFTIIMVLLSKICLCFTSYGREHQCHRKEGERKKWFAEKFGCLHRESSKQRRFQKLSFIYRNIQIYSRYQDFWSDLNSQKNINDKNRNKDIFFSKEMKVKTNQQQKEGLKKLK